jgi:hypothetical protein
METKIMNNIILLTNNTSNTIKLEENITPKIDHRLIEENIQKLNETVKNILFLITPKGNIKLSSEDRKGLIIDIKE